jgi:TonB family protein
MNRLHKKCLIASTGVHSLLLLILLVGPAFLTSKSRSEDLPVIDFIPSKFIDAPFVGGGNRNAKPPPVVTPPAKPPPQPQPQPAPEKQREPDPPKVAPKIPKPDPQAFEDKTEPKPHKPQISTKLVEHKANVKTSSKETSAAAEQQAQERQRAERQRFAEKIANVDKNIREVTSPGTTIEEFGPGTGGPAYASYAAWVRKVYEDAWELPEDTTANNAVAKATVTIANDGAVLSARLTQHSGDGPVDRSVQRTLDKVKVVAPFPDGAKEKERTYIIKFMPKIKRGLA